MCGFAGEFVFGPHGRGDLDLARKMAAPLACRGPDQEGAYLCPDGRCSIGFRRLAVLDIAGSLQPMTSSDGEWTIAHNGEAYNFADLRSRLQAAGHTFRTTGDTEVLLQLAQHCPDAFPQDVRGMFAIALYRRRPARLLLARDRLGQKPLYYALLSDRIVFASQPRSLLLHPQVSRSCSLQALVHYLQLGYIPAPLSIWPAIRKLEPGHVLEIDDRGRTTDRAYWSIPDPPADIRPAEEQLDHLRSALARTVREQLVSDVPLGILLSGGLDSAILAGLASREVGRAGGVRTFTAGFDQTEYDERPLARRTAAHFGTDHTELTIPPVQADQLEQLCSLFDEPFADSSALATWLVCRLARSRVTVALGGEGGDEVFAGYDRYRAVLWGQSMSPARYAMVKLAAFLARPLAGRDLRSRCDRLVRFADGLGLVPAEQYLHIRQIFSSQDLTRLIRQDLLAGLDTQACREWFCELYEQGQAEDEILRCQRHDLATYLGDDLLVKSDTSSMAVGLELRAPMLDEEVVQIGLGLELGLRVKGRRGKQALRQAFGPMLPPGLLDQPKRGFGLPLAQWLRGPLRDLAMQSLLCPSMQMLFEPAALAGLANDHLTGRYDHSQRLWALIVLGRWLEGQSRTFA